MLLTKFRNKNIHLLSTLLIIFAIVAKMLVPIAHASNNSSDQKGFLASLCSGNKIVFVELNLPTDSEPKPSTVTTSSKCPLCNIVEQHPPSNTITPNAFVFLKIPHQFTIAGHNLLHSRLIGFSAIRAPPLFS